jgi:hypothetical protein
MATIATGDGRGLGGVFGLVLIVLVAFWLFGGLHFNAA